MTEIIIKAQATKNSLINSVQEQEEILEEIVEENFSKWIEHLKRIAEQEGFTIKTDWDDNDAWGSDYIVDTDDPEEADISHDFMQTLDQENNDFWGWYN